MAQHDTRHDRTRTLIISDIHLGTTASRIESALKLLRTAHFTKLIILGDLFEDERTHRLKEREHSLLAEIKKLAEDSEKEVIWIEGNHDRDLSADIPRLIGARVEKEYAWSQNGIGFLAIHGDGFDGNKTNNLFVKAIAAPVHAAAKFIDRKNSHVSLFIERFYAYLSGMTDLVAREASSYAHKNGSEHVFCGHTHDAVERTFEFSEKPKIVHYHNIGCWTRSPSTYALIDEKGAVDIRTIVD